MYIKLNEIRYFKILILLILLFNFNYNNSSAIESKIIVKINDKIITNIDIKNEANYLIALNPKLKTLKENKIFEIAKSSLIREKIKELETSRLNQNIISKNYLDSIIEKIYKNIGLKSKNEFIDHIANFKISISSVEKKLTNEALWNQLIYQKFYPKIKVDENKIKNEIKSYKQYSNSYLLYEILFSTKENEKSIDLYNRIEKSISENGFENTASIFSISQSSKTGGRLGWIDESSVNKKILKEISVLKIGEHTKPILLPGGFLIIKVDDKKSVEKKIDIENELIQRIKATQNEQLNQYSIIFFNKIKKEVIIDEK
tara:strand:+ start:207 stop:1154 length:948 start_codon:yes stop_codon:yes gene_type:complete